MSGRWTGAARAALQQRLGEVGRDAPGRWSFVVSEGEPVAEVDGEAVHAAASVIKVPLLVAALRAVDAGRLRLDDVVAVPVPEQRAGGAGVLRRLGSVERVRLTEALDLMTTLSDNTAANLVIDALGGLVAADAAMTSLGLVGTRLHRRLADPRTTLPRNVTTAADQAHCLEQVVRGETLGGSSRRLAQALLGAQTVADRLPSGVADDVRVLHKTGEIDGVRHDVGVLLVAERAVVLAALGSDLPDAGTVRVASPTAQRVIGAAATAVAAAVRTR